MSRAHRELTEDIIQQTQEDKLMVEYGCECCALACVHTGSCVAHNVPMTSGYCNGWVLKLDWCPAVSKTG